MNNHSDLTNQEKLEEVYRLSLENNHMLHKLQNQNRIGLILRIVYWLAIVGALGGAFYYIRPFFDAITGGSEEAQGVLQQFEELRSQFPEAKALQNFFNRGSSTEEVSPETQQ